MSWVRMTLHGLHENALEPGLERLDLASRIEVRPDGKTSLQVLQEIAEAEATLRAAGFTVALVRQWGLGLDNLQQSKRVHLACPPSPLDPGGE